MEKEIINNDLCNCRFQLGDMGYYECQLEKNHEGNHKYTEDKTLKNNWRKRNYSIEWEVNPKKDLILDLEWMKTQTNLVSILDDLLKKYDFFSHYKIENPFNEPIHGSAFSCYCYFHFKEEIEKEHNFENSYENIIEFLKPIYIQNGGVMDGDYFSFDCFMLKELLSKLNINVSDYDLHLTIDLDL